MPPEPRGPSRAASDLPGRFTVVARECRNISVAAAASSGDPSPRNIHVAAAASPRPVSRNDHAVAAGRRRDSSPRNIRVAAPGVAATRLHGSSPGRRRRLGRRGLALVGLQYRVSHYIQLKLGSPPARAKRPPLRDGDLGADAFVRVLGREDEAAVVQLKLVRREEFAREVDLAVPAASPVSTEVPRRRDASPRNIRVAAAASTRRVSTDYPRRSPRRRRDSSPRNIRVAAPGVAATRLHGISASRPRRRRDASPRNIRVAAAGSP